MNGDRSVRAMAYINSIGSHQDIYSNIPSLTIPSAFPSPLPTPPILPPVPSLLPLSDIRQNIIWIRDILDPLVAREGSSILSPDDALTVHAFLDRVRAQPFTLETIRQTRLYQTLTLIRGKATRWPRLIIDECDALVELWTVQFGSLRELRTPLYEKGGRLFGVCKARDLSTGDLLRRFAKTPGQDLDDGRAMRQGHLGFLPGSWWFNTTFAFREGIITRSGIKGGVCALNKEAYALVLVDFDEQDSPSPNVFKYAPKAGSLDASAIVSTFVKHRAPIRVLRSHRLQSLWSPIVGIRYDGLYTVKGWTVILAVEGKMKYTIKFERLEGQTAMSEVLMSPNAVDREDYQEYYRIRALDEKARRKKKGMSEKSGSSDWGEMSRSNPMLAHRFSRNPQSQKTSGDVTNGSFTAAAGATVSGTANATVWGNSSQGGEMPDVSSEPSEWLRVEGTDGRRRSYGRRSSNRIALVHDRKISLQVDGPVVVLGDYDEYDNEVMELEEAEIDGSREEEVDNEVKEVEIAGVDRSGEEEVENDEQENSASDSACHYSRTPLNSTIPSESYTYNNNLRRNTLPSTALPHHRNVLSSTEIPERRLSSLSTTVNHVLAEIMDDANIKDESYDTYDRG